MAYYNYHAKIKSMIKQGKLIDYYFTDNQNGIKPALVLIFNDERHPIMPVRQPKWAEYIELLPQK